VLNFASAPEHWQDFVFAHQGASAASDRAKASLHAGGPPLEFQECTLFLGSVVTLVGELHRDANGTLMLLPLPEDVHHSVNGSTMAPVGKVLVSDDPSLFGVTGKSLTIWDTLGMST